MRFSLFYLPVFHEPVHRDSRTLFQQILEESALADELGLDKVWCAEHRLHPYGGDIPHPCLLLAAIAQRTQRIRLATGGVALPLHRSLELAEQLAMVDAISGGRLEIGVVRAFLPFEFDAYNVDMGESRSRFEESVEVIQGLFANDRFSFDGQFCQLEDVALRPRPVQRHPRLTLGAVMSRESFEFAGRNGLNLMVVPYVAPSEYTKANIEIYRDSLAGAGHDPAQFNVMAHCFYYGDTDPGVAKEVPRVAMQNYLTAFRDALTGESFSKDYPGYEGLVRQIESLMDYELMYGERTLYAHPDKFHRKVEELAAIGVTELALSVNMPGIPHAKTMKSLEFLGAELMPNYQ